MNILYIATSFPKPDRGDTIYTDLAEALREAGHALTIVVSEQASNNKTTQLITERGLKVLRITTGDYYGVGFIEKGITSLKIPVLIKKGIKRHLNHHKFDFLLFESPPVTTVDLVSWAKKRFNCPAYLMLKDIFPQNAVDLGIIKRNSLIHRFFTGKEEKLYKVADYIGCMSPANRQYIIDHNPRLDREKLELFPNTKRLTYAFDPVAQPSIRKKLGLSEETCIFLFGGNMGRPQGIELLCLAVRECKNEKGIFFLFVGRGSDRWKLEKTIEQGCITNAVVLDDLPRNEFEQIARECNVGLIVLDPRFTIPNYPSRILTYLDYAKPVLAATDKATDIKDLIEDAGCGEWVWSGDDRAFIEKVKEMSRRAELNELGQSGRAYMESNFLVRHSIAILESHF